MIILAIIAVVSLSAAGAFTDLRVRLLMVSTINDLIHFFHSARHLATSHGTDVVICSSGLQMQCDPEASWLAGWLMFVNHDGDEPPRIDADEPVIAVHRSDRNAQRRMTIAANRSAFVVRPFGRRASNGTFVLCPTRGTVPARAVIVSYTGKPRSSARSASDDALVCAR